MTQAPIDRRLEQLREVMSRERLAACIFPCTDPHTNTGIADHWKSLEWISGFSGNVGTAVVTMTAAALWTDVHNMEKAKEQLQGTEYQVMCIDAPGTQAMVRWMGREIECSRHPYQDWSEVAVDGTCWSFGKVKQLIIELRRENGITLRTNFDALRHLWTDRPPIPTYPIVRLSEKLTDEPIHVRLEHIRKALRTQHADGMLMASSKDIAWTLNLYESNSSVQAVRAAYLLISSRSVTLFADRMRMSPDVIAFLKAEGVSINDYAVVSSGLKKYFEYNILMAPDEVNYSLYHLLKQYLPPTGHTTQIIEEPSPIAALRKESSF